jgi:hypothetical protein
MKYLLVLAFVASPAFACNDGSCEPPPPPPPPSHETDGGSAYMPYSRQYFSLCTCTEMRVAWGFETPEFREQAARGQCLMLREKRHCELSSPDTLTPLK